MSSAIVVYLFMYSSALTLYSVLQQRELARKGSTSSLLTLADSLSVSHIVAIKLPYFGVTSKAGFKQVLFPPRLAFNTCKQHSHNVADFRKHCKRNVLGTCKQAEPAQAQYVGFPGSECKPIHAHNLSKPRKSVNYFAIQFTYVKSCERHGMSMILLGRIGTFVRTLVTAESVNHNHRHGEEGINILHRAVALEALYDSADSFPQPRCHPGTRTKMLDDLLTSDSVRPNPLVVWACWGGKVRHHAGSVPEIEEHGLPGRGILFQTGPHHLREPQLFTTLAYQLALNNRYLKPLISQSVEDGPSVVGKQMDAQLHQLIAEPCQSVTNSPPVVLLIDGLDECHDQGAQQEILRLIGRTVRNIRTPFNFSLPADQRLIFVKFLRSLPSIGSSNPSSHSWTFESTFATSSPVFIANTEIPWQAFLLPGHHREF
jgi:hypothetical protein